MKYIFAPQKDITAYELASLLPYLDGRIPLLNPEEKPPEIMRHLIEDIELKAERKIRLKSGTILPVLIGRIVSLFESLLRPFSGRRSESRPSDQRSAEGQKRTADTLRQCPELGQISSKNSSSSSSANTPIRDGEDRASSKPST